jgi:hypothetical protein
VTAEPASRPTTPPWSGRRDALLDAALAVAVFAGSLALLAARGDSTADTQELDLRGVLLAALASLPLVAWRRAPLAVFAMTAAASAALNGLGYPPGPPLGPTVALYLLAVNPERTRAPRSVTAATVAGLFVVHVGAVAIAEGAFPTVPLLFGALVWGGAWVIGDRVRLRRARIVELEERARRAERDAQRAAARGGRGTDAHRARPPRFRGARDQRDPRAGRRCKAAKQAGPRALASCPRDDRGRCA